MTVGARERDQLLLGDAAAFLAHTPPGSPSAAELERLLASGAIPTDRSWTWHAVASLLAVTLDGRALLARNKQGWGTVGGHIDPEDLSIRAAAVREAREEIGRDLGEDDLAPLTFLADVAEVRPGHAHLDFCYLHVAPEPFDVRPSSDVADAAWFALTDLPEVNAHIRVLVDAARERTRPRIGSPGPGPAGARGGS